MKIFLHRSFEERTNGGQKMTRGLCRFTIVTCAYLVLSGCATMLLPNEDMRYDKAAPIFFAGGVNDPNVKITIQVWNLWSAWEDIGTFTSDSNKWPPGWSVYAYPWFGPLTIPSKYWGPPHDCACIGSNALVRAKLEGEKYLFTVRGDVVQCFLADPLKFYLNCGSSYPDWAWVRSLDYRDFGKECAKVINDIRAKEGKKALLIDENGECDADSDAQCNYQWELTHDEAHHCPGPGAQNECTYKSASSSIDYILNGCITQAMYEDEKQCWLKNPPSTLCGEKLDGCYKDPNCMCGHYVNMVVCPNYTKVSCGIYKTPNGLFKSVQNFLW